MHWAKSGTHREMGQEFTRIHDHPVGDFKFEDNNAMGISLFTSSELGALCEEIEQRNLG